jgi:5-methylcytosine-specific restriction endonuclease McrA
MPSKHRLLLAIVHTDATFERVHVRGEELWRGRCIHCNSALMVALDGRVLGPVTVEHIVPRNHGGADDLPNLALACARCNSEKGLRHDHKRRNDPRRVELEARLLEKRRARWRDPVFEG